MGTAISNFLQSLGSPSMAAYTGAPLPGTPPAETASAEDKAKFDEAVRKYQLDRKAYEDYKSAYQNRVANFNIYDQPQFSTTQPRFTQAALYPSAAGGGQATTPATTPATTTAPEPLRAPTYGAISQFSNLTPQQQGNLYLQQRALGYTDADIRKATAAQVGTPSEEMMAGIYKTAYPQYTQAIEGQYGSQFNRSGYGTGAGQIDYPGFNYYINQLASGAVTPDTLASAIRGGAAAPSTAPVTTPVTTPDIISQPDYNPYNDWMQDQQAREAASAGGGGGAAKGGYISKYAGGGAVRTHYQTGGNADLGNLDALDEFYRNPSNFTRPAQATPRRLTYQEQMEAERPVRLPEMRAMPIENIGEGAGITEEPPARRPGLMAVANVGEGAPASGVVEPAAGAQTAGPSRGGGSQNPMEAILARYLSGSGEASRELAAARQRSQTESEAFYNLIRQMAERGESPASRSEMYFRLAAAFGAPTRTGKMGETLAKVGEQMGEYSRGRQAEESERRGLLVRAQEARMAGAREDLATTRALAAQEGTERAGVVRELVKEYIRSGEPQTEAEKEARALGLVGQEKADFIRRRIMSNVQQAENRLTALDPNELKTYNDNRELSDRTKMAIEDLRRAIALNPRTLPGGIAGRLALGVGSAIGSDAQIIQNSEQLQNILSRITVDSLKATFPGAISNAEREALERLSGSTSASLQSRERIMRDALRRLETMVENAERRMRDVQTRANRYVQPGSSSTEPTR